MADVYFSGQGKVYVGTRNSDGSFNAPVFVGNVPELTITLNNDTIEHKESQTGKRLPDLRLTREQQATVNMTLEDIQSQNLELMLQGTKTTVSTSSAVAEAGPASPGAGSLWKVKNENISAVTVKKDGSAINLTTDYTFDAAFGLFTFVQAQTGAITFDYTWASRTQIPIFSAAITERYLRFQGLNTAYSSKKLMVEIYRIIFDPTQNMNLINDDIAQWQLQGSALYDSTREPTAALGPFGRVVYVDAVP